MALQTRPRCLTVLSPPVFRQLNTSMALSQMSAVQCRLAPLIQVIQDCSHLYHYAVKLMFKLHSCESPHPALPLTASPVPAAAFTRGCPVSLLVPPGLCSLRVVGTWE